MNVETLKAAARFHALAKSAARNGGFWVSAGGGTANVVAGIIARATGASFEEAHRAMDLTGCEAWGEDWYAVLASAMPWGYDVIPQRDDGTWWCRFDAGTVARAACRPLLRH